MFTLGVAERAKNSRENSLRVNSRRNRLAAAPVKSVFKVGQGKKNWPAGQGTGNRASVHSVIRAGAKNFADVPLVGHVAAMREPENAKPEEIRGKTACRKANTHRLTKEISSNELHPR